MIASHHRHHGAAPGAGAHDGPAHGIPDIHERQWPRRIGADALHQRAFRPQGGKVIADAAALLHGEGGFAQGFEDARHVIRYFAHDKAVEQGDVPPRAGAGQDAPGRQEMEIAHGGEKFI